MVHNLPDITGSGVATPLALTRTSANWAIISAAKANTGVVRIGDKNTSANSGSPIPAGTSLTLPATGNAEALDLGQIFYYAIAGDIFSVIYGKT